MRTVVVAREGDELVLLPGEIDVDIQFHVLALDGRHADAELEALIGHLAHVGQQFVEGERGHRHVILVEHVGRAGIVILRREHYPALPEAQVCADVECRAGLPFQVRVGVAPLPHRDGRCAAVGDCAHRPHEAQAVVGVDAAGVARLAIAHAEAEDADLIPKRPEERLLCDVPRSGHRGEPAPLVVVAEHRTAVGAKVGVERVSAQKRVREAAEHRAQHGAVGVRSCAAVWDGRARCEIVVAELVGRKALHLGPEARALALLIFVEQIGREMVSAPGVVVKERDIAEPVFRLAFAAVSTALSPHPRGTELGALERVVGIGAEGLQVEMSLVGGGLLVVGTPREQRQHIEVEANMGVEVEVLLVVLLAEQHPGRVDLRGGGVLVPVARGVAPRREGRVLRAGAVEELPFVEGVLVFLR